MIKIRDTDDIPQAAEALLGLLPRRGVVAFHGEMGAGKTTLIREMCRQLGVEDNVNSPTFSIVNEYHTADGERIYHFDCYRIDRAEEALDFGCEEYFASGDLCLIEWPEKIEGLLPEGFRTVSIKVLDDGMRKVTVQNASE